MTKDSAEDTYEDLVDAVQRRVLGTTDFLAGGFRASYRIELGAWEDMTAELFLAIAGDARSPEEASRVLKLTRGEFEALLHWARGTARGKFRAVHVVTLDRWYPMINRLLLAIVADAGSARAAAKVIGVPRSTLSEWIARAKRDLHMRRSWPRPR